MSAPTVRRRTRADVPVVVDLLVRQQPLTRYPYRDPLPVPVEQFVDRAGQLAAWVAEDGGRVVGHVGVTAVADAPAARTWTDALDLPASALGAVATFVVDPAFTGRGVGGALLGAAERHLVDAGLVPVLEVLTRNVAARSLYRSRGWTEVGSARVDWLPDDEGPVRFLVLR